MTRQPRQADFVTDLAFDRFWSIYPRRKGGNPKHPARLKFELALREGATAETIIAGTERYAAEQAKLMHAGTEFIAMASTWLNQRRWQDYAPINGALTTVAETVWITVDDPRWVYAVEMFRRAKHKTPPIVPGLGGSGWHFPTALMVTGDAKKRNPADRADQRGSTTGALMDTNNLDQNQTDYKAGRRRELSETPEIFSDQSVSERPKDLASI